MKRHRRDPGLLRWVVAQVRRNTALALVLLGLAPGLAPGDARATGAPVFDVVAPNPLNGMTVGLRAAPAVADFDADGDPDVLSGEYGGSFRYFENTGTALAPSFIERLGPLNPANGLATVSAHSHPVLVDLDGDRDLDLVAGSFSGSFQYFENTGDARNGHFVAGANPLSALDVGDSSAATFGDLDQDGDSDLLAGDRAGGFHYFENTGSKTAPAFVERIGTANPMAGFSIDLGLSSLVSPALGDFDRDGDLDLVAGFGSGSFRVYRNQGTARRPRFEELEQASNPLRGESVGSAFSKAALADLDGDGDLDVVGGADGGGFSVFENQLGQIVASDDFDPNLFLPFYGYSFADVDGDADTELIGADCTVAFNTGSARNPQFGTPGSLPGLVPITLCGFPTAVDVDRDGDFDFYSDGGKLFRNTGTASSPAFAAPVDVFPILGIFPVREFPRDATFADVDHDGDPDAFVVYVSEGGTQFVSRLFLNTSVGQSISFSQSVPVENFFGAPIFASYRARLMDVDDDGDGDFLVDFDSFSRFARYFENVGTGSPVFLSRTFDDRRNPFRRLLTLYSDAIPVGLLPNAFSDLDGDGDGDSIAQIQDDDPPVFDVSLVENGIVRPSPRYFGPADMPFTDQDVGFFSSPAAGDLDGDGDPDFVAVDSFGTGSLHYYENTGTAILPRITERIGVQNPFGHLNAGFTPILTLADLDADGDRDLVAGSYSVSTTEALHYFINTGTATSPAFEERVDGLNPFQFVFVPRGAPAFGDLDADGDPDLVMGGVPGTLRYFRNFGLSVSPGFSEVTDASNPFDGIVIGSGFMSRPTLGDIDRDGDLDVVSGDEPTGAFFYLENTGTSTVPAFLIRTGAANPFEGLGVGGIASTPVLVDLDADGDLDVVSGGVDGTMKQFTLPEPSFAGMLGAGLALLGALMRRRKE